MADAPDADDDDKAQVRDTLRFFEVAKPTYSYGMAEAIADGHLVPYEIYRAMTAKTAAADGFSVARADIDWGALDAANRTELEALFEGRFMNIIGTNPIVTPIFGEHRMNRARRGR